MAATSEAPVPSGADTGNGALAQLGERLHGMQEVSGSIPLGSTSSPESYSLLGLPNLRERLAADCIPVPRRLI